MTEILKTSIWFPSFYKLKELELGVFRIQFSTRHTFGLLIIYQFYNMLVKFWQFSGELLLFPMLVEVVPIRNITICYIFPFPRFHCLNMCRAFLTTTNDTKTPVSNFSQKLFIHRSI